MQGRRTFRFLQEMRMMNADQLRDYLSENIALTFPDIPVWVACGERVCEIGRIFASDTHVLLEVGKEEELSKFLSEQSKH
jgi:hypothetical protein